MYTVGDGKATQLSFFNKGKTFSISFITQRLRCGPSTLNKPLSKCTFRPRAIFYSLKSFYRVNYTSQYMIEVWKIQGELLQIQMTLAWIINARVFLLYLHFVRITNRNFYIIFKSKKGTIFKQTVYIIIILKSLDNYWTRLRYFLWYALFSVNNCSSAMEYRSNIYVY